MPCVKAKERITFLQVKVMKPKLEYYRSCFIWIIERQFLMGYNLL